MEINPQKEKSDIETKKSWEWAYGHAFGYI